MDNQLVKNINKIKSFLLDLLFPCFCFGCGKEKTYLCQDCRHLLEILEYDYCLCEKSPNKFLTKCSKCQNEKLNGLYFALPFKKPIIKKLVYKFKYKPYTKDLAKTLASLLVEHFILTKNNTNQFWENSVLIPIPLDNKRLKSRGYNQSEELAKELSKILKVPVISNYLIKIKETQSQMKLNKLEREKNLHGAFAISSNYNANLSFSRKRESSHHTLTNINLRNKKIFLVDDVYTTGSTMQECAKVLKQAGAKQVFGICIAREE